MTATLLCGVAAGSPNEFVDPAGDAVVRRTDFGSDAPINPNGNLPDIVRLSLEGWLPVDAAADPYVGVAVPGAGADLLRLTVRFAGLVNPPGPLGFGSQAYDPFRFGNSPVFGFLDFDIDADDTTGGELGGVAFNRYLAQVARLGMVPQGPTGLRIARDGSDLDSNISTPPHYERTGAEFNLTLCGCFTPTVVSKFGGNADNTFEAGETWIVRGRFFERAQVFRNISGVFGGSDFGLYNPFVNLRFEHDTDADETVVTLVFPLTMQGAAMLRGGAVQPADFDVSNDVSVIEAMEDAVLGFDFFVPSDINTIVGGWRDKDPADHLDPTQWVATALVGTAYSTPQNDALFVWTDSGFGEVFADFNNDGARDAQDLAILHARTTNGPVTVPSFAFGFDLLDLNADGVIDDADGALIVNPADFSGDGTLDFFDVQLFLASFSAGDPAADLTGDGILDFFDVQEFLSLFAG